MFTSIFYSYAKPVSFNPDFTYTSGPNSPMPNIVRFLILRALEALQAGATSARVFVKVNGVEVHEWPITWDSYPRLDALIQEILGVAQITPEVPTSSEGPAAAMSTAAEIIVRRIVAQLQDDLATLDAFVTMLEGVEQEHAPQTA